MTIFLLMGVQVVRQMFSCQLIEPSIVTFMEIEISISLRAV